MTPFASRSLIVGALLASGCGDKANDGPGRYDLAVQPLPPGTQIVVAGKPAGVLDAKGHLEVELPKGVYVSDGKGSIVAKVPTPCGPKDVVVAPSRFAKLDTEKHNRSMKKAEYTPLEVPATAALQRVRIDRTRAPDAEVTIGSLALTKAMAVHDLVFIGWPDCAEGRSVRVNKQEVGTLPAAQPKDHDLVIATTPTCYRLREVMYTAGTYAKGADDRTIERTQLTLVPKVTDFLKAAPSEVTSSDVAETRHELLAVECAGETKPRAKRSK